MFISFWNYGTYNDRILDIVYILMGRDYLTAVTEFELAKK